MSENLMVELRPGRDGPARAWKYYLPAESRVLEGFCDPVSIIVKRATSASHPATQEPGCHTTEYLGGSHEWGDVTDVVNAFTQLWPEALQAIAELGSGTASLVYFSAPATYEDLYDLWPYMPFGIEDERRFFVSEVCKSSRTRNSASGWLCVEYAYEDFKRMTGPDGFGFRYGTTIMGISVSEAKVAEYLKMDFLSKNTLELMVRDDHLRGWWFCDADFEGMTVWHKDVPAEQLLMCLSKALKTPAEQLGLTLKEAMK